MHSFPKLVSDLGTFRSYVKQKMVLSLHEVYEHKDLAFLFWDIFCGACRQWGELASKMRKGRNSPNYHILYP